LTILEQCLALENIEALSTLFLSEGLVPLFHPLRSFEVGRGGGARLE